MTSKLLFSLLVFICAIGLISAGRPSCDANGKCKYGGACLADNRCYCQFRCTSPTWDRNPYCLPRAGSKKMEVFRNICELMARACETQQDLPVIKFDFKKPKKQRCQAKNTSRWHLCPKPEDFMGPCGGTLNERGTSVEGGVCLKDRKTDQTRCECPSNRVGADCQGRLVLSYISRNMKSEEINEEERSDYIAVIVGVSLAVGVFLGVVIFFLTRLFRAGGKCGGDDEKMENTTHSFMVKEENMNSKNSRTDLEVISSDKEQYQAKTATNTKEQFVIEIGNKAISELPTNADASAASSSASRRQRTNGVSVHNSRSFEDNNNNNHHTNNNKEFVQKKFKSNFLAGEKDLNFNQEKHSTSTPAMTYDQTNGSPQLNQGISKMSPLYMEAYTL